MDKTNKVVSNINIEHARITFRNFSGKEGKFNPAGRRNFCVLLDDLDLVRKLQGDGWNIKFLKPRDDFENEQPYMQVTVAFGRIPPKIYMISNGRKSLIDEDTVDILDWAEFENVDLIIRPYNYEFTGRRGVKAYLKTMYATIAEDEFSSKYQNVPDTAKSAIFAN